jgi:hypothetical protein
MTTAVSKPERNFIKELFLYRQIPAAAEAAAIRKGREYINRICTVVSFRVSQEWAQNSIDITATVPAAPIQNRRKQNAEIILFSDL